MIQGQTSDTIDRKRAIGSAHSRTSERVSDQRRAVIATGRVEETFMGQLLDQTLSGSFRNQRSIHQARVASLAHEPCGVAEASVARRRGNARGVPNSIRSRDSARKKGQKAVFARERTRFLLPPSRCGPVLPRSWGLGRNDPGGGAIRPTPWSQATRDWSDSPQSRSDAPPADWGGVVQVHFRPRRDSGFARRTAGDGHPRAASAVTSLPLGEFGEGLHRP